MRRVAWSTDASTRTVCSCRTRARLVFWRTSAARASRAFRFSISTTATQPIANRASTDRATIQLRREPVKPRIRRAAGFKWLREVGGAEASDMLTSWFLVIIRRHIRSESLFDRWATAQRAQASVWRTKTARMRAWVCKVRHLANYFACRTTHWLLRCSICFKIGSRGACHAGLAGLVKCRICKLSPVHAFTDCHAQQSRRVQHRPVPPGLPVERPGGLCALRQLLSGAGTARCTWAACRARACSDSQGLKTCFLG